MKFDRATFKAKALMARDRLPRPKFKMTHKQAVSIIPNLITVMGLCVGLTSVRFSLENQLEFAVLCILVAAVLDMMDGRVARMLNSESPIGAELDSLSDVVCFGVAPTLSLYIGMLSKIGPLGWGVSILFVACMALRLARFNVLSQDPDKPEWACNFFTGVPAPMGAYLILSPLMFSFYDASLLIPPTAYAFVIFIVSLLLVSRIPTFAFKKISVNQRQAIPIMLGCVIYIIFGVINPWLALAIVSPLYLMLIPMSIQKHKKVKCLALDQ